jgi:hypothetical protein
MLAALKAREDIFAEKTGALTSEATKAGAFGGSAYSQALGRVLFAEVSERSALAWKILREVVAALGIPIVAEFGNDLKATIRRTLISGTEDVKRSTTWQTWNSGAPTVSEIFERAIHEVETEIDLFVETESRRSQTHPQLGAGTIEVEKHRVFLSHAAADEGIAAILKREIEQRLTGVEVFCASFPGDIPLGFRWSAQIQVELRRCGALVLLATERSMSRPWVWFEAGTFWFDRPIIILCFGRLKLEMLPAPLSERESANVDSAAHLGSLFSSLSSHTGISETPNGNPLEELLTNLNTQEAYAEEEAFNRQGWRGAPWEQKYLAFDGPLQQIQLIDPVPYDPSFTSALTAAGYTVVQVRPDQLPRMPGCKRVYLTDRREWRQVIVDGDVVLAVRT